MKTRDIGSDSGYSGVFRSKNRRRLIASLTQPLTPTQLSLRTGMPKASCCESLRELRASGHVECLTPKATSPRVYFLTDAGVELQHQFYESRGTEPPKLDLPEADWGKYARMCTSHRSIVLKTLREPMQPSRIKRRAYHDDPSIRMSANNARETTHCVVSISVW